MIAEIIQAMDTLKPELLVYTPSHPNEALNIDEVSQFRLKSRSKMITVWWDYDEQAKNNSYLDFEKNSLKYSDLILDAGNYTKTERLKSKCPPYQQHQNVNKVIVGPGLCDMAIFKPCNEQEKIYDIAIFGSSVGKRSQWINILKEQYKNRFHHIGGNYSTTPPMPMVDYAQAIAKTKIFVNTQTYPFRSQCKGKVREAIACKTLLLEEDNDDTRSFYSHSQGIVYFKSPNDLINSIDYYLGHEGERDLLAGIAHKWYCDNYSYYNWFNNILSNMGNT